MANAVLTREFVTKATAWANELSAVLLPLCDRATPDNLFDVAVRQERVLPFKAADILSNIEQDARQFGLDEATFTKAAVKCPPLFYQKPETLLSKKPYINALATALGYAEGAGFAEAVKIIPVALTSSLQSIHARYVLAKLGLVNNRKISSMVVMPAAQAEKLIVGHFKDKIAKTGKGARALQVMQAQGLIKKLPEGIAPIERPARGALKAAKARAALEVKAG